MQLPISTSTSGKGQDSQKRGREDKTGCKTGRHPQPDVTSSMARISKRSLSITVMKSWVKQKAKVRQERGYVEAMTLSDGAGWGGTERRTYRDNVSDAAIEVAFVVFDGYWPVFFDSLHSQRAVQLRPTDMRIRLGSPQNHSFQQPSDGTHGELIPINIHWSS